MQRRLRTSGNGDDTDASNDATDGNDGTHTTNDGTKARKSYLLTIKGTDYISKAGLLHVLGVSPTTIQMMVENKRLPAGFKHNNRWYWTKQAISDLIDAGLSNNRTHKRYLDKLERFEAIT